MRGRFITFEGGEGTGKSTHVPLLAERLRAHDVEVVATREPGGSLGGEIVRHVLLSGAAKPFGPAAEAILFAAARDDHLGEVIRPALRRGAWVICDRFVDSTRVYQGVLGHVDPRLIRALERIVVGVDRPDLTVILDAPAEIGLSRAAARRSAGSADRFEAETVEYHAALRSAFRALAVKEPGRCALVDSTLAQSEVAQRIWRLVQRRLLPPRHAATAREVAS